MSASRFNKQLYVKQFSALFIRAKDCADLDISDMEICCACFGIKGTWRHAPGSEKRRGDAGYRQRCRCERTQVDEPTWPGFDFNTCVELCNCCGAELLRSGSKWAVWFCDECKAMVGQLHAEYQRYIIPVGRHSFHGGLSLDGVTSQDPAEIAYFVHRWSIISDAIGRLDRKRLSNTPVRGDVSVLK